MNQSLLPKIFTIAVALAIFVSCASDGPEGPKDEPDQPPKVEKKQKRNELNLGNNTTYKLPSPVEFFIFLYEEEALFNKDILNDVEQLETYHTTKSKAINFGIYASDLAYCTVFAKPQQTFFYFKNAKTLANELGLTEGFDENIQNRLQNNLNDPDSLYQITSDSYWEACNYLESQDKNDILAYIIIGGWIESVYIALNSVDEFNPENEIVIRIHEQHLLLENLIDHLNTLADNEQIAEITERLNNIKAAFNETLRNDDGAITKEQYDGVSDKIQTLRNEFVM